MNYSIKSNIIVAVAGIALYGSVAVAIGMFTPEFWEVKGGFSLPACNVSTGQVCR